MTLPSDEAAILRAAIVAKLKLAQELDADSERPNLTVRAQTHGGNGLKRLVFELKLPRAMRDEAADRSSWLQLVGETMGYSLDELILYGDANSIEEDLRVLNGFHALGKPPKMALYLSSGMALDEVDAGDWILLAGSFFVRLEAVGPGAVVGSAPEASPAPAAAVA